MEDKVSTVELEFVAHRLLPSDWRTLGRKLLTTIDPHFPNVEGILGNLEYSHQDEGARKIVLQTMLRWQSMWGNKATVALLVGALEDLGMVGIANGIREMVARRNDTTLQGVPYNVVEMKGDCDPMVRLCREALKNHYTMVYKSNLPLVWKTFGINVQTMDIPLKVVRLDRAPSEKFRTQVDVEVPLDQHTMMLQGPAGVGKTQLCYKLAYDWVTEKDPRLKNVKLLFVLSAMYIGKGDILDGVYDQIFPAGFVEKLPKRRLERWIKANSNSVMFVIDDVDVVQENCSSQDMEKTPVSCYINGKYLRDTRRILTCRSSAVIGCNHMAETTPALPNCHANYLINGFSEGAVDEVISKFFSGSDDSRALGRRLKETVSSNDYLSGVVQNPMYALMVCTLWKRGQSPPASLAQLIEQFIALISEEFCSKKAPPMSTKSIHTTLRNLGKLAWASLEVGQNALTHQHIQDVIGNDVVIDMGLLQSTGEDGRYKFVHRIFREYFAATHVATASAAGDQAKYLQTLWSTGCRHSHEYGNVCLYTAGLLQDKSHDLFAAFTSNLSELTRQGSPPCCLNTACSAVVESGHPNITAPLVAKALPRDLTLDFQGKPPPPNVLHGLAELILAKHVPKAISLKNLWVTKPSCLLHLGEAIKGSKSLSSLNIDVTGMDMSLSSPERADNSVIVSFYRCIAENRGIACLHINADINDMDENAVAAMSEVIRHKPDLHDLRLVIHASSSCSARCRNMVAKGYKMGCKREKNIEVFNERLADALGKNTTLRSLWVSVQVLEHKLALEVVAPAIASHPCLSSLKVLGLSSEETRGYAIEALAHVLLKSKTLKSFSLSVPSLIGDVRCDTSTQRVNILCAALKECRTLEMLDLSFTYLFAREKLLLAEAIMSARSLKEVSLTWRTMNEAFLVAFCRAVRAKSAGSLKRIALSGAFDSRGLVRLGKTIVASQSLMEVTLQHSKFHDKGLEEFADELMEAVSSFPEERDAPLHITLQGTVDGDCADDAISTAELLSMELQDSDHTNLTVHLEAETTATTTVVQEALTKKSGDFAFMTDLGRGDTSSSGSQQDQVMRWLTRR